MQVQPRYLPFEPGHVKGNENLLWERLWGLDKASKTGCSASGTNGVFAETISLSICSRYHIGLEWTQAEGRAENSSRKQRNNAVKLICKLCFYAFVLTKKTIYTTRYAFRDQGGWFMILEHQLYTGTDKAVWNWCVPFITIIHRQPKVNVSQRRCYWRPKWLWTFRWPAQSEIDWSFHKYLNKYRCWTWKAITNRQSVDNGNRWPLMNASDVPQRYTLIPGRPSEELSGNMSGLDASSQVNKWSYQSSPWTPDFPSRGSFQISSIVMALKPWKCQSSLWRVYTVLRCPVR